MSDLNLVFTGCKNTTYECMKAVLGMGVPIDLLITISPETAEKNKVAGYYDLRKFAEENSIRTYVCNSYTLKTNEDIENLNKYNFNVLLVIGWQRLIPEWLLSKLKTGAFGMHGSSRPLPYGRGRSPMNWSIIQNRTIFITNLFKYNKDVDSGEIIATETFDINPFDTAQTMHYKNMLAMVKILKSNINDILDNNLLLKPQLNIIPSYYPKRNAEDGIIFWDRDTGEIYNLIRAVTKPFHGAFTFYKDKKIIIWQAFPFDTRLFDPEIESGTVLEALLNSDFVVKTGSDSMIVTNYETIGFDKVERGMLFNNSNYVYKCPY